MGCKIISITAYKGGVGKSPITVDVATELARRGSQVAIITGDVVYRCSMDDELREHRRLKIQNSPVTYFDESDVILYHAELHDLERKLEEDLAGTSLLEAGEIRFAMVIKLSVSIEKEWPATRCLGWSKNMIIFC